MSFQEREDHFVLPFVLPTAEPSSSSRFEYPLQQGYWGVEALPREEIPKVEGGWQEERLWLRLHLPEGREEERWGVQLDPVGDLESFYEYGATAGGKPFAAVYRRTRSGYKRHGGWQWEGASVTDEVGGRLIELPFRAIGAERLSSSNMPKEWQLNFFFEPKGGRPLFLRRPPKFSLLRFLPG